MRADDGHNERFQLSCTEADKRRLKAAAALDGKSASAWAWEILQAKLKELGFDDR